MHLKQLIVQLAGGTFVKLGKKLNKLVIKLHQIDHYSKHARGVKVIRKPDGSIKKLVPKKGGPDLPSIKNLLDYDLKAKQMWTRSAGPSLLEHHTTSGDIIRYDTIENTFSVLSPDGFRRTFFKLDK